MAQRSYLLPLTCSCDPRLPVTAATYDEGDVFASKIPSEKPYGQSVVFCEKIAGTGIITQGDLFPDHVDGGAGDFAS